MHKLYGIIYTMSVQDLERGANMEMPGAVILPEAGLWAEAKPLDYQLPESVSQVIRAARTDFAQSKHKNRAGASAAMTATVQAIGFSRAPSVLIPHEAISVLHSTGSPVASALTTALLFGTWCYAVGATINNSMGHYRSAVKEIGRSFAAPLKHFSDALPNVEREHGARRFSPRHIGKQLLKHIHRGFTSYGVGIVPYIATAGMQGASKSDIRRLSAGLSLDGAAVVGGLSLGVGETIVNISRKHPELAHDIQNYVGDIRVWYGIAGALMVAEWLKKRRMGKQASVQEETIDTSVEPETLSLAALPSPEM